MYKCRINNKKADVVVRRFPITFKNVYLTIDPSFVLGFRFSSLLILALCTFLFKVHTCLSSYTKNFHSEFRITHDVRCNFVIGAYSRLKLEILDANSKF